MKSNYQRLVEQDSERCKWCGTGPPLTIDHIVARSKGGSSDFKNLQLLCPSCNSKKGPRDENQPAVRHAAKSDQLGFTMIPNVVLLDTRLSLPARVLYAALKHFAWSNTECYPGQKRLSEILGCSERSIRDYVDELIAARLIRTEKRGFGKTNLYIILPLAFIPSPIASPADSAASGPSPANISVQTGSQLPVSTGSPLPPKKMQEEKKTEIDTWATDVQRSVDIDGVYTPEHKEKLSEEEELAIKAENKRLFTEMRKDLGL